MNNRIETLRALCFTKEDLETITNLGESFSEKDIEFMVEFKKIYELGLPQLKKFIDKLDDEGEDLDTYSIIYYIEVLLNGPLGSYVREFSKDKKYFINSPDIMGMLGNKIISHQNNTIYEDGSYVLGCAVDTYNKLPPFIQTSITTATKQTEDVFRSGLKSSSETDNTLPIVDKDNQTRYSEEKLGKWVIKANANYMVKDSYFYLAVNDVSEDIFKKVEDYLGEEDFRMYGDKKKYNPFDSEKNTSNSTNSQIKKIFKDGDTEREVILDLMGDEFDSDESRTSKLKISGIEKDKEYLLHTNEGQLGN